MEGYQYSSRKTILLADPDEFFAATYKDGIEQAGFDVIVATDGHQTLEILKSALPDAVLLELILPKVNGFEVLEFMNKSKKLHTIPVIVFTTLGQPSDDEEARSYGAVDVLVKSETSPQDLIASLDNLFQPDN